MRSRTFANDQVAEVARRRLALLSAELAETRPDPGDVSSPAAPDGSGEHPGHARPGRHAHRSVGVAASTGGWVHDRLPPTLQGRVRLGTTHLAVISLMVAGALALAAWWTVRADGDETELPPMSPLPSVLASPSPASTQAPQGTPSAPGSAPSATPTGSIVVDVAGKVRRPGIATLPLGARVVDALEAAGGARPGVRLGTLNLARVLADGEQILVGLPSPAGTAASAASAPTSGAEGSSPMVNINTAGQSELEDLPGVGPVTAQAILDFRAENGAFRSVDELLEVSGIGEATLAEMAPFVTL
jgi:competence protein ComEA